jgi:hypothetical protein
MGTVSDFLSEAFSSLHFESDHFVTLYMAQDLCLYY